MPVSELDVASLSQVRRRATAIAEFVSVEVLGGLILAAAVVGALSWANLAPEGYVRFWSREISLGLGPATMTESLAHWITDGLMTVFFFVAGLEIKRELVRGELRDPRTAALPVFAALGGMVVPALLFLLLNAGGQGSGGWGIPMATDIAFAVAVVALLGTRVPRSLKLFLLTLAIVDDIGAIIAIALFYSSRVSPIWLLAAALAAVGIIALRHAGLATPVLYVVPAVALWVCFLESGVHATLAGVVLGLLTPTGEIRGRPVIERLEHCLHPWAGLVVVPLFALASAGVVLDAESLISASGSAIAWGVGLGLVVGKPLGIVLVTMLALRLRLARLPHGVQLLDLLGAGLVAGIGFTVSLFVAELSFRAAILNDAKIGILAASLTSAAVGVMYLVARSRRWRRMSLAAGATTRVAA